MPMPERNAARMRQVMHVRVCVRVFPSPPPPPPLILILIRLPLPPVLRRRLRPMTPTELAEQGNDAAAAVEAYPETRNVMLRKVG